MKTLHYVCKEQDLPPGERRIIQVGKRSIGIFNVGGEYYALLNVCPHQFAPLCKGKIGGYCPPSSVGEFRLEREGEIIRCPWHGWEFDIKTGRSIFNPHKVRTGRYDVRIQADGSPAIDQDDHGVETFSVTVTERALFVEL